MKTTRGFRLKLATLADLSNFLDDFRSDATKVLAGKWTMDVAREAVFTADLASLGLKPRLKDFIGDASQRLNGRLSEGDFSHHAYNCRIEFLNLDGAILAVFEHGDAAYQQAWKRKRAVEFWGWSEEMARPNSISAENWALRGSAWTALRKKPRFGRSLTFTLLDPPLPTLTWRSVANHFPEFEARVDNCVEGILTADGKKRSEASVAEVERVREYVTRTIAPEVHRELMSGQWTRPKAVSSTREIKTTIVEKRDEKATGETNEEPGEAAQKASHIDHADVILAHDGRTFIAVPSVGLAVDTRIFVQVGSRDLSFTQSGVNFGTVPRIPPAARDHLKSCKEAVLVEVEKDAAGRLLRAKFIAIVTDITFSENQKMSLSGFKRPSRSMAAKELEEWEKTSKTK